MAVWLLRIKLERNTAFYISSTNLPLNTVDASGPSVNTIINRETASIVYKFINILLPSYLSKLLNNNSCRNSVTLRNYDTDLYVKNHSLIVLIYRTI